MRCTLFSIRRQMIPLSCLNGFQQTRWQSHGEANGPDDCSEAKSVQACSCRKSRTPSTVAAFVSRRVAFASPLHQAAIESSSARILAEEVMIRARLAVVVL